MNICIYYVNYESINIRNNIFWFFFLSFLVNFVMNSNPEKSEFNLIYIATHVTCLNG